MLARLDGIEGVEASRVDWTGRHLLLVLKPGADSRRAVAEAKGLLGGRARRLGAAEEAAEVAAFERGEPWMRVGESARLSGREAEVLSARLAAQVAEGAGLDESEAARVATVLREELTAAFERAHEAGGEVRRLDAELPEGLARVERRLGPLLPAGRAEKVRKALRDALDR